MPSLQTFCLPLVAALLAACGGSYESVPLPKTYSRMTCALPLDYIASNDSGVAIPESTPPDWSIAVVDVTRKLSCAIERMEQVKVGLCLQPSGNSELEARLVAPDRAALNLDLQTATLTPGCAGLLTTGNLLTVTLDSAALAPLALSDGNWLVQVRDHRPGVPSSTLVGWSLQIDGLR